MVTKLFIIEIFISFSLIEIHVFKMNVTRREIVTWTLTKASKSFHLSSWHILCNIQILPEFSLLSCREACYNLSIGSNVRQSCLLEFFWSQCSVKLSWNTASLESVNLLRILNDIVYSQLLVYVAYLWHNHSTGRVILSLLSHLNAIALGYLV